MRLGPVIALAFLVSACNSVKDQPLPSGADDPKLSEIGKNLNDDDKKLLVGYLMRREMAKAFGGRSLDDGVTTVGQALEAQQKWAANMSESERRAEALKLEVEQKRKAVADQINRAITVAFVSAEFVPSSFESGRYDDYERFNFAVQNTGPKPIKALKGQAVFIDTFGDEYVRVPMQFEDQIAPGEKKSEELSMEINKFMDEHKRIMGLDSSKKFRFEPEQIVFADGSTVRAPEATE